MNKKNLKMFILVMTCIGFVANLKGQQITEVPDNPIIFAKTTTECVAGGPNTISCAINADVQVENYGIGGNCSVTCQGNAYACCGYTCKCEIIESFDR